MASPPDSVNARSLRSSGKASVSGSTGSAKAVQQNVISAVIQDILTNDHFLKLVEQEVDKRLAELTTTVEKLEGLVLDLESGARERDRKIKALEEE